MMLDKVKNTVLTVVSALFVVAGIWGYAPPINEATLTQLLELLFLILGSLGIGVAVTVKYARKKVG